MLKAVVMSIVLSLTCLTSTSNSDEPRRGSRDIVKRATHPPRIRRSRIRQYSRMYYQQPFYQRYQPRYYQPLYLGIYDNCYPQYGFRYNYFSSPGIHFRFRF